MAADLPSGERCGRKPRIGAGVFRNAVSAHLEPDVLIIDEVHNLRNFKTRNNTEKLSARKRKRGENFSMTGNKTAIKIILEANKEQAIKKTLFMTGTLMINGVDDLDSIMALGYMKPPLLKNFEDKWYNIVGPPYTPLKLDEKKYDQSYTQLNQYFSGIISTVHF